MIGIETTETKIERKTKTGTYQKKSVVRKLIFPGWLSNFLVWLSNILGAFLR